MREIVIPGEKISDRKIRVGEGSYIKDGKVYSSIYGIVSRVGNVIKVVPLHGRYIPKKGDQVIGVVKAMLSKGCFVDINSPYDGFLSLERVRYNVGDILIAEVSNVSSVNEVLLDKPRKLSDGRILEVQPTKVPRIIGKKGSMLKILRDATKTYIIVGRNGRVFVRADGRVMKIIEEALRMIEKEALSYGLTARVKEFLEKKVKEEVK